MSENRQCIIIPGGRFKKAHVARKYLLIRQGVCFLYSSVNA
jgi:hypothetical protein